MAKGSVNEGDLVSLHGRVTHTWDDGTVTVQIHGFSTPVTVLEEDVEVVERAPKPRRKVVFDKPD